MAGCSGFVSVSSSCVLSLSQPALHVGKQIGGGDGWRACTGNTGMAGGATTTGGDGGKLCAQPLTSVSSSTGVRARTLQLLFRFMDYPLQRFGAPLLFRPCGDLGLNRFSLQLRDLLGMRQLGGVVVGFLGRQSPRLQTGQGQRGSQCDRKDTDHSQPLYFGDRTTSTSLTWCRLMSQADRPPYSG